MSRGGKREGAGRPPGSRNRWRAADVKEMAKLVLEEDEGKMLRKMLEGNDLRTIYLVWSTLRAYLSGKPPTTLTVETSNSAERILMQLWEADKAAGRIGQGNQHLRGDRGAEAIQVQERRLLLPPADEGSDMARTTTTSPRKGHESAGDAPVYRLQPLCFQCIAKGVSVTVSESEA